MLCAYSPKEGGEGWSIGVPDPALVPEGAGVCVACGFDKGQKPPTTNLAPCGTTFAARSIRRAMSATAYYWLSVAVLAVLLYRPAGNLIWVLSARPATPPTTPATPC